MAGIALPNLDSVRLHERFGFRQVALFQGVGWKLGGWHDVGWWQRELPQDGDVHPPDPVALDQLPADAVNEILRA